MGRREGLTKCLEHGVPIFEGRIDKSLFLASLRDARSAQRHIAALKT